MRKNILILGHNDETQFIDIFNQYTLLFDKNLFSVTVVYLTGKPNDVTKKRTLAENVIFLDLPKGSLRNLKIGAIRQVLTLCKKQSFQLVICHRYKPTYLMLFVAKFCHIPALIAVMHELGTMRARGRQLLIAALRPKNMLFAGVSNAVRDDMRKDLWCVPQANIQTLYNMIDVVATEPALLTRHAAREALKYHDNDILFANIARLVVNKDQKTLIAAFALVKKTCPHAKLIIMGSGELESELKTQVEKACLTEDVHFAGFVPGAFRYMKAFDCFVLPSTQEAFGRVLLEAMIAKVPIIAARTHGIPEVVGDAGTIVPARDIEALAEAMITLYQTSVLNREMAGEKAYARVTQVFSIPQFHQQFWQLPTVQFIKE